MRVFLCMDEGTLSQSCWRDVCFYVWMRELLPKKLEGCVFLCVDEGAPPKLLEECVFLCVDEGVPPRSCWRDVCFFFG